MFTPPDNPLESKPNNPLETKPDNPHIDRDDPIYKLPKYHPDRVSKYGLKYNTIINTHYRSDLPFVFDDPNPYYLPDEYPPKPKIPSMPSEPPPYKESKFSKLLSNIINPGLVFGFVLAKVLLRR